MEQVRDTMRNEGGYVLVVALLVMAILSLLGIAGMNTSIFEKQIAGNDWNSKRTFYKADAGVSMGSELIEQNLNLGCINGFAENKIKGTTIYAVEKRMWGNPSFKDDTTRSICTDSDADVIYPYDGNPPAPAQDIGYLYFGGHTELLPGGSLQMAAGYEGLGKSAAQGGVAKYYDIYSRYEGFKNSQSIVGIGWRHVVGTEESTCNY